MGLKLPQKVFVKWVEDDDTTYLDVGEEIDDIAVFGEKHEAGIYELRQIVHIVNDTTMVD